MKLLWTPETAGHGIGFGGTNYILCMRAALEAAGVTLTADSSDSFDLAISLTRPDYFLPFGEGKRILFFTTVEYDVPCLWGPRVAEATLVVTPSTHGAAVLSKLYAGPIFVCPEGVDPVIYPFYQRKAPTPPEHFRFLFVGAARDTRKGFQLTLSAWQRWIRSGRMPSNVELYMKGNSSQYGALKNFGGLISDARDLPIDKLVALYNSAHAFILPSLGEGWGLTLTEAMATGCPSIWTHWSAMPDYADETTGFPVTKFTMKTVEIDEISAGLQWKGRTWRGADAGEDAIIARMEEIYHDYPAALARGRRASERMHSQYTWAQAAEKFIAICEKAMSLPVVPRHASVQSVGL